MSTVLQTSAESFLKNYKQLFEHAKLTHENMMKTIKSSFQIQHAIDTSHGASAQLKPTVLFLGISVLFLQIKYIMLFV